MSEITEAQVKRWLYEQAAIIKDAVGEDCAVLYARGNCGIFGNQTKFEAYASGEPRHSPEFDTVQECVDWLILEKSKQITDKMQEEAA